MLDCNSYQSLTNKSQTYISTREEKGSLFLKHDLAIEIEQYFQLKMARTWEKGLSFSQKQLTLCRKGTSNFTYAFVFLLKRFLSFFNLCLFIFLFLFFFTLSAHILSESSPTTTPPSFSDLTTPI